MALKAREKRDEARRARREGATASVAPVGSYDAEARDTAEIDALKAELAELNGEIARLTADADRAVNDAAKAKDALDQERQTNATLRSRNKELADDLADAEDECAELKKKMSALVEAAKAPAAQEKHVRKGPASMAVLD
ncbi:MAG: hypothetical protein AAFQ84_02925 [Pseudomonadota bacterium]